MTERSIFVLGVSNIMLPAIAEKLGLPPMPFVGALSIVIGHSVKQDDCERILQSLSQEK
ncbi:MAG: hypothetical protein JKY88_08905 [Pseudomonadales bacterium]|nr:hypothetical protein [Pseudomonadales bacterium]